MPFTGWFTGTSIPKNLVNNITLYALDDMLFKLEVHINYGLFSAFEPLFRNTASVKIAAPRSAIHGLKKYPTRPLSPYVSYEQRQIPMHKIFCAVIQATDQWSLPNNLPPQFNAYQAGRGLLMYNVSADSTDSLIINNQSSTGNNFYNAPAALAMQSKELTDAYAETFQGVMHDPTNGYTYRMTSALLPYLPYFSNCYTFDNYISLWMLLESQECTLPDTYDESWYRYEFPALPDQDDVRNTNTYMHTHTYMNRNMSVRKFVTYVCMYVCVPMYVYTNIKSYIHTYTHTSVHNDIDFDFCIFHYSR